MVYIKEKGEKSMEAIEIKKQTNLCESSGQLSVDSIGWARFPLIRSNLRGSYLRKKKWNYWCVTSPDCLFSATISHLDYAAVMFIYVLDLQTLRFQEKTTLVPLGKGIMLPEDVHESVRFEGKDMKITFEEQTDATIIRVQCPNFSGKENPLSAEIIVERPPNQESLNVVVPWGKTRFQYTSKQVALPAKGVVNWAGKEYQFSSSNSFGCLDFGRGVWPYHSTWNWGAASGMIGDKRIGLNFGGQWTDGTGQTENGIVVDNRLSKINEKILWSYDTKDYMKPWKLKTENSDQVSLTFTPKFERIAATKAIIVRSEVHQMIGTYSGKIVTNDGEEIMIESLLGWAEDHRASW